MINKELSIVLETGLRYHQAGQLQQAEAVYRKILDQNPDHPDTLHLLGVLAHQTNSLPQAEKLISRAISIFPENPIYHFNLGNALKAQEKYTEAINSFHTAILLKPDYSNAYNNLGNILNEISRHTEAIKNYQLALKHDPKCVEALNNLGNVYKDVGKLDKALVNFQRALTIAPGDTEIRNNVGAILQSQGKIKEAIDYFQQALATDPSDARIHCNMGNALTDTGQHEAALKHYQKALALRPDYAKAHSNLGNALKDLGQYETALEHYQKALALKPDYAEAHSNLLFLLSYHVLRSPREMLEESQRWDHIQGKDGKVHSFTHPTSGNPEKYPPGPVPSGALVPSGVHRRLRIGYVSPDLRNHAVSYFLEPILAEHDRTQVEVFCYAEVKRPDKVTQRLQAHADYWRSTVGMTDEAVARLIFDDNIDILIDLAGHTGSNRLRVFTYKPAPIQAAYLGYFATTGLAAMDYWITDQTLHPQDTVEQTIESIYRLPRCCLAYQPTPEAPEVTERNGEDVVFGSFNQLTKTSPAAVALWAQVLQAVPQARLLIKTRLLADTKVIASVQKQFIAHGISAERLTLLPHTPSQRAHLETYSQVDIALDTIPRTGGSTTTEALWMGVPVITLAGERFIERLSASMLTAVGLTELIADSQQDYVARAVALANDRQRRTVLRTSLRERMATSPLCNGQSLAQALESAYREMWQQYLTNANMKQYDL